ncbi:DUF3027 domain-containing protein [Paeniglutamicibacter psychrophenolicus]|uniref:DUF3027 domain-containing protein n=1 Tax=Paeniglutamicibacter psychrophenolicus TaxID=257454 RepID=UPI0027860891|nr:DUF3027 domain-containing protein [Paeniglutamicibacter psychrophenolicus]MDQ0092188.1 hypothetical protein [Paeniglutamicibacter psychrophenolicus]
MARKPILDTTLAKAVDQARAALLEITDESMIGEHLEAVNDGERLVTHRFEALRTGYEGWCWFATLTRIPRAQAKDITVCEVGILPGEDALLAPAWVPWAERVRPEEMDAERRAAEEAAAAEAGVEAPGEEPGVADAGAPTDGEAADEAATPEGTEAQDSEDPDAK